MKTIELTQGLCAMVDDEDYAELNAYKWCACKHANTYYAVRYSSRKSGKRTKIYMHREIAKTPREMLTDHKDGNGLNNCKTNLRIATQRQNRQNIHTAKSSKYPGAYWDKRDERWRSMISVGKERRYLGNFKTDLEAHNAYLSALKSLGETIITDLTDNTQ
jgi:hypothetical protein